MEKKELAIVTYIKNFGLEDAIETFKLKCKDYPHKILLKYDQIGSDMSLKEVQECRGLILEKGTWRVLSLAFKKFFNSAEGHAAKIDWLTARTYEKCDGSIIQLYWDWNENKWYAGTSGMAEGEGEVNDKPNTSFSDLFWDTIKIYPEFDTSKLRKGCVYVFELMTPYNIVVCPHGVSKVALLAIRDLNNNLSELSHDEVGLVADLLGLPLPITYDLGASNVGHLIKTFDGMPYTEEGYIICDANFNRVKLKNPAYLSAHHLKSKTSAHHIMMIIKTNEVDEYGATFPERLDEMNNLKLLYEQLISDLESTWTYLEGFKPKNITKEEQKKFAIKVFEVLGQETRLKEFSGMFFALKDRKFESVRDFIFEYDSKRLYEKFTN